MKQIRLVSSFFFFFLFPFTFFSWPGNRLQSVLAPPLFLKRQLKVRSAGHIFKKNFLLVQITWKIRRTWYKINGDGGSIHALCACFSSFENRLTVRIVRLCLHGSFYISHFQTHPFTLPRSQSEIGVHPTQPYNSP